MSRWIKVDVNTPTKGEILAVAADCGCIPEIAFTAWFRVWSWFDEATADGRMPNVTPVIVDGRAQLSGFAESMARSGWLSFDADGCTVTNWCRHNGSCAKRRSQNAARMNDIRKAKHLQAPVQLPHRPVR